MRRGSCEGAHRSNLFLSACRKKDCEMQMHRIVTACHVLKLKTHLWRHLYWMSQRLGNILLGWPKSPLHFFCMMALVLLSCLNFIGNISVSVLWQLSYQCTLKKHLSKLLNFCVAILIMKMEDNEQNFQLIMPYYFKKGKNATETQKKICAVYGEGAVTDRTCQKWFAKFLVLLMFWPNNSLLWACLMHWKMHWKHPWPVPWRSQ